MTLRFVLTGAPGAGKTTIALALRGRGYTVVGEAATDVIGESPELQRDPPAFLDRIVAVQRQRQLATTEQLQVYDRSPVCTLALAAYLGLAPTEDLAREATRIARDGTYHRTVFFVGLMGFIVPTAARRIGLEDSRRFEGIHREVYAGLGYELVEVPPAPLDERVALVERVLSATR